jgi:integrase
LDSEIEEVKLMLRTIFAGLKGSFNFEQSLIERIACFDDVDREILCARYKDGTKGRPWSANRKRNVINSYSLFLKINGLKWEPPKNTVTRKIPFIPNEPEIDQLIAGCPTRVATFLQILKETAMRSGELINIQWKDVDTERKIITLNNPEKNSLPRQWNKLSHKLWDMLNALPRQDVRVFGPSTTYSMKNTFIRSRRKLSIKLQNPRLLDIHFHTLRHWKATMVYHNTKDLLHTMAFLGHKKSDNTLLYVQLDEKLFNDQDDKWTIKAVHNEQEAIDLGEVGFEPYLVINGVQLVRKRK